MADPSRTASVGDGLDGLKRVGLPASAHQRRGAQTQQILASVVRTARQRGLDLNDLFTTLLQAPRPMVPASFKPAAQ